MSKLTLNSITGSRGSKDLYNANNTLIEQAIENTLSLDGTIPNSLTSDIDLNSNSLLNVGSLNTSNLVLNGVDLNVQVQAAATSASNALVSENNASTSEANAATSASSASSSATQVEATKLIWRGAHNNSTSYVVNDAVSLGGSSYICILANSNQAPPNALYWDLLASQGSPGAGTGDMLGANNLSDVANVTTARANLSITATNTPNTPQGNIASTNVQAAINELDTEKSPTTHTHTGVYEPADATILKQADIGTTANKLVQLGATAKLPAVDGSQLTGISTGLGVGQTWQDVTSSRSVATNYTSPANTAIVVRVTTLIAGALISVTVNGLTIDLARSLSQYVQGEIVIPANTTYSIASNTTSFIWYELR